MAVYPRAAEGPVCRDFQAVLHRVLWFFQESYCRFYRRFLDDILGNGYTDWLTKLLCFYGTCRRDESELDVLPILSITETTEQDVDPFWLGFLQHLFDCRFSSLISATPGISAAAWRIIRKSANSLRDLGETVLHLIVAVFYLVVLLLYSLSLRLWLGWSRSISHHAIQRETNRRFGDETRDGFGQAFRVVYAGIGISSTLKAGAEQLFHADHQPSSEGISQEQH